MQRNPLSCLPWIIPRLRIEGRHGFSTLAVCHLLLHPIALGSELSPLELLASIPHSRPRLAFNRTDPTRGAAAPKPRNRTKRRDIIRHLLNYQLTIELRGR